MTPPLPIGQIVWLNKNWTNRPNDQRARIENFPADRAGRLVEVTMLGDGARKTVPLVAICGWEISGHTLRFEMLHVIHNETKSPG